VDLDRVAAELREFVEQNTVVRQRSRMYLEGWLGLGFTSSSQRHSVCRREDVPH
jgi:hypothetical protein